jgi:hypothetical protein
LPRFAALALASAVAAAPAAAVPSDLVAAMLRDDRVATCANEAGKTAQAYVRQAFALRELTLRGGERMTVAEATDFCLMLGQSTRIYIFERALDGYRRVLDEVTVPGLAEVSADGTAVLPTHESIETIFEAAYVWNGTAYAFSGSRSHVYDVALGQRRPYELPVRFAPGAFATTLSGSVAFNFGQDYVFEARAGQKVTIELTNHTVRRPSITLSFGRGELTLANLFDTGGWSGKLPQTGTYKLTVYGTDASDATRVSTYAIRLAIR